ncbi:MAG: ATP-dependent sacrificial sulfur transferase LarE [Butyrivibrio sp.]|nr:ATP-dependent sacrificial sulfur transferase LarE [Butyrivibrio sp.]
MTTDQALLEKYDRLKDYMVTMGSALVAFSGGVDSTFLLYAAKDALGDKAVAATISSMFFPGHEFAEAMDFCRHIGARQLIIEVDVLGKEEISSNPPDRCYHCKKTLFTTLLETAKKEGLSCVCEGSNLDDKSDYRPGMKAVAELGVKSPLEDVGFTKAEIRALSEHFHLPTYNKPSFACLASRIPYGEKITDEKLTKIADGEQLLMELGFKQFRVRCHGNIARIELLPTDFERFMSDDIREKVYEHFKHTGFSYVTLDIRGYRTGSLNETLKK